MKKVQNGGGGGSLAACLFLRAWVVGVSCPPPPPEQTKGTGPVRSTAKGAQLIVQTEASSSMRVERELQGLSTANQAFKAKHSGFPRLNAL